MTMTLLRQVQILRSSAHRSKAADLVTSLGKDKSDDKG